MNRELNLDTFNQLIFQAMKPDAKKSELLLHELQLVMSIRLSTTDDLIDALNNGNDYHEILDKINTIDSKADHLAEMYQKALEEEEEAQKGDPNE